MDKKRDKIIEESENYVASAYVTQPISQPDKRQKETNVALPNAQNVIRNKKWVEENEK